MDTKGRDVAIEETALEELDTHKKAPNIPLDISDVSQYFGSANSSQKRKLDEFQGQLLPEHFTVSNLDYEKCKSPSILDEMNALVLKQRARNVSLTSNICSCRPIS